MRGWTLRGRAIRHDRTVAVIVIVYATAVRGVPRGHGRGRGSGIVVLRRRAAQRNRPGRTVIRRGAGGGRRRRRTSRVIASIAVGSETASRSGILNGHPQDYK